VNTLSKSKKKTLLVSLDELGERMPSLLNIDHPCAQRQIAEARRMVEVCTCVCVCARVCLVVVVKSKNSKSMAKS
jgi:hypothetical protein